MAIGKLLGLALGLASTLSISAQTTNLTVRTISLNECIEMALHHNFDLRIERYNIEIARLDLRQLETVYDPQVSIESRQTRNATLNQTFFPDNQPTMGRSYDVTDSADFLLSGIGPMGMTYTLTPLSIRRNYGPNRTYRSMDWTGTSFNKTYTEYSGTAEIQLQQPLLRNFLIDGPRRDIMVSKKYLKMSEFNHRGRMIEIITLVRQAYYDLIFARENVTVQEKALELAQKLQSDNKAKVKAGTLPPLDEKQAESQVATTRADLLTARQLVGVQENLLKNMITRDLSAWKKVSLLPSESLVAVPEVFDVQESWRIGLSKRPDLAQLRVDVDRRDIEIRYRKNQALPALNLVGNYGHAALGTGTEDVLRGVNRNQSSYYFWGFELRFPWGSRQAKFNLQQARDQRAQAELFVQQLQQNIMVQIDDAINTAKTGFDRVAATRQAREYAEMALDAEQKKLENGKSTSFFVLQFQRDLTAARSLEIQALADYNKALATVAQAEGTTLERLKLNVEFK